jgi:hypothetical protein
MSFRALALAALLFACGSSSRPAATTTPTPEANMPAKPAAEEEASSRVSRLDAAAEKLTRYLEDTVAAIEAAGGDCDKAADGARAVWDQNKDAMGGMMVLMTATPRQDKVIQEKYGARMEAAETKLGNLEAKCRDNPKWKELEKDFKAAMGMPH